MTESLFNTATDLNKIRIEQASLLKARARGSAITVQVFVILFAVLIGISVSSIDGVLWLLLATLMVLVTVLYAKFMAAKGITHENVRPYLFGHVIICCCVGLLWGGYAIHIIDFSVPSIFIIAIAMPMILTVGGMLPSSAYRRGYIALAACALLPFAIYLMFAAPEELRYFGVGTLAYFGLAIISSAQAEINTRDGIIARTSKVLNEELARQNEIIKNASEDKTRFLAATSHDLSQPLHAQGFFIQALRKMLSAENQHSVLDKIEDSWRVQGELLEGLVDITRLDSHAIKPKPRVLDLRSEIQTLAAEFKALANEKSITLATKLDDVSVYTDPVLLARIMRNLLSNAINFTPNNGAIDISVINSGSIAKIIIRDTGIGIHESEHDSIYDEYVQVGNEHRDRKKGLGLGLSIVRRLVNLLNITIELASQPGKGSTFTLTLPSHNEATRPLLSKTQSQPSSFPTSPLIVLIDDEKAIRDGMSMLLTDWGCQIICTATGEAALSLLSITSATPTLLIIDKQLANGENGINVIERIREEVNETTPAILITGDIRGLDDISHKADIQLMNKPVTPDEIKRVLRAIVEPSNVLDQS